MRLPLASNQTASNRLKAAVFRRSRSGPVVIVNAAPAWIRLTGSAGAIGKTWVELTQRLLGWGALLVPLALGLLGVAILWQEFQHLHLGWDAGHAQLQRVGIRALRQRDHRADRVVGDGNADVFFDSEGNIEQGG